jgi:hypothetical protein
LCTSVLPSLIKWHLLCIFLSFMTYSPYISTCWRWISVWTMFSTCKNQITNCTSQLVGSMIDTDLYKATWQSNQFAQWLGKHWGNGRGPDNGSQPSNTAGKWLHGQGAQMVLT